MEERCGSEELGLYGFEVWGGTGRPSGGRQARTHVVREAEACRASLAWFSQGDVMEMAWVAS